MINPASLTHRVKFVGLEHIPIYTSKEGAQALIDLVLDGKIENPKEDTCDGPVLHFRNFKPKLY